MRNGSAGTSLASLPTQITFRPCNKTSTKSWSPTMQIHALTMAPLGAAAAQKCSSIITLLSYVLIR